MQKIQNYINGELVAPVGGQYMDNIDPSRGKVYSLIPDSDEKDVEIAIKAAKAAFPSWSVTPKDVRAAYIMKIADLIDANLERLAKAES
jgi:aminomuconate-semialdehyde/2-hydroxymuconate-6-semialdehyde dehydrogenase